ncbi:MAG: hypothetical protein Q8N31_10260 [Reyranella sp.]|nr:hypothetical protein [Reyranella sp.]MDP3160389.1 hypothetical protein [Reyranella sp.]
MIKKFSLLIVFDAVIVAAIFVVSLVYYGDVYAKQEMKFSFYQKYFYSAVNVYCLKDPDGRQYNAPGTQELNERIDLANISCSELEKSPKHAVSYFNGWHDTHPILSTLIGYNWRLAGLTWEALWPMVGSLAALTVLAFYLILRCFGLPWYIALLLFPATIPFPLFEQNLFFLRDFSKVPFILLAFALLGILFKSGLTYRSRLLVLASSTCVVSIGMGFRQDTLVLMPAIVAGAAFTSSVSGRKDVLRFAGDVAAILSTFILTGLVVDILRTSQVAQLQGYPHFIVQGFADDFWKAARAELAGISFLPLYSDMVAWAAVDANTTEKVEYFASLDPTYTTSGFNLILKYSSLSAADMVTRVFSGLSAVSHSYWAIPPVGGWLLLLLVLICVGKWRLGFFLIFTILSLAAAGSIQFSPRHIIHLLMLDRVVLVIIVAALLGAGWQYVTSRLDIRAGLALGTGTAGTVALVAIVVGAHFVQQANLSRVKSSLEALPWFPSQEAYRGQFPNHAEAIERFTIDLGKCSADRLEAVVEVEGRKWTRPLERLDGTPRSVYFAVFNPAISTATVDVVPRECVTQRAWGPLGDGSIPPLQFFDPEAALKQQSIMRHLGNIASSLL